MGKHILSQADFLNRNMRFRLKGYYFQLWNEHCMKEYHRHERIEMMYAAEGECSVWVLGEEEKQGGKEVRLSQNEMILLDAGVWHKLEVKERCRVVNLEFIAEEQPYVNGTLKEAAHSSPELIEFLRKFKRTAVLSDQSKILKVAKLILAEAKAAPDYGDNGEVMNLYCNLLMIEIARSFVKATRVMPYEIHIKKALKYIASHICEKMKSEEIAEFVDINYAHLERVFKKQMNMTLTEYIGKKKVEIAAAMLEGTSFPIGEIAKRVGFGSRQQFNNVFKKIRGVSPNLYRQSVLNNREYDVWYGFDGNYDFEEMNHKEGNA